MTTIGRFAPTPSGRMHLGNAFTALLAWLSARSQGGRIVLRIEDLDRSPLPPGLCPPAAGGPHLAWPGLGPGDAAPERPLRRLRRIL